MRRLLLLSACLLPLALPAAEDAAAATLKAQQRVYDGIMSDSDVYAGEGIVSLKSFGDDLARAKASGRERARANMVEGIRVRVVSKTTDTQSNGADGSKEEVKAESSSSADLELEGIQYKYLDGYPKEGQLTVLAYLSKEEWQRQSDKRMLGYRPLRGLRLWGGVIENQSLNDIPMNSPSDGPTVASNGSKGGGSSSSVTLGGDFYWSSWIVGVGASFANKDVFQWQPKLNAYELRSQPWSILHLKAGYEWTPWATRVQVVLPLQAEYNFLNWDPYFAQSFGVAGGLRLRYWASDRVAFDVGGLWHYGLSQEDIKGRGGESMYISRALKAAQFGGTAPELSVGVLWNGF
jgi:hypothetical protein